MVDFASTQAQAKEVAPLTSHEGAQTEATIAKPPSTSPLLPPMGWPRCTTNLMRSTPLPPLN
jgi:hypothetical protein